MADEERETVVVEDNREPRPSYGWMVAVVIILAIIIVFFLFGGFNLFNGGGTQTDTINVETAPVETAPAD